ncbi:hypothetical protein KSC_057680 [Ktedonobacter sp. SOSP1-52]|uniref:helix-turn-helix domain-containing protein n=1 Tax=Ktedonobacter sp. SOSP1-52 TaxID=2778366 RepID=UPI001A3151A6|nr:helix-turn-helix domain-containing protein [Ktedonobacter sp. SOSP1-52]GHO66876.1 hypothetical protein KSC_057680 [Ktedonobacter sp. SOSP1-52]
MTRRVLAAQTGHHHQASPTPVHPSLSPAQREEAITLLQQPDMSIRKIASALGTSRGTIQRLVE